MSAPVSHILHARAERITTANGPEVHLHVGVHHDKRWVLAFTPELAAQIAPALAAAARARRTRVRMNPGDKRLPILKPSGGVL